MQLLSQILCLQEYKISQWPYKRSHTTDYIGEMDKCAGAQDFCLVGILEDNKEWCFSVAFSPVINAHAF